MEDCKSGRSYIQNLLLYVKHRLHFSFVFSARLPEEACFQQAGSSVVEGTSQALEWNLRTNGRYQPASHYF
jgi:hypothetical protein